MSEIYDTDRACYCNDIVQEVLPGLSRYCSFAATATVFWLRRI